MANLISCVECNRSISSEATRCPHCDTGWPRGLQCKVCLKPGKASEMAPYNDFGKIVYLPHPSCREAVLATDMACPTCKQPIATLVQKQCSNCGQSLPIFPCHYCGQNLHLNAPNTVTWEALYWCPGNDDMDYQSCSSYHAHALCSSYGTRTPDQIRGQAEAGPWKRQKEEEQQRKENKARQERDARIEAERVYKETKRRAKTDVCVVCGKPPWRTFLIPLFGNGMTTYTKRIGPYEFVKGVVHVECKSKPFCW